jgi:hypothetical protein
LRLAHCVPLNEGSFDRYLRWRYMAVAQGSGEVTSLDQGFGQLGSVDGPDDGVVVGLLGVAEPQRA